VLRISEQRVAVLRRTRACLFAGRIGVGQRRAGPGSADHQTFGLVVDIREALRNDRAFQQTMAKRIELLARFSAARCWIDSPLGELESPGWSVTRPPTPGHPQRERCVSPPPAVADKGCGFSRRRYARTACTDG
jgi:hypothetical protein